jgi:peroxiredoxin
MDSLKETAAQNITTVRWLRVTVIISLILLTCSTALNVLLAQKVRELNSVLMDIKLGGNLQEGADVPPIDSNRIDGKFVSVSYSDINQPTILYIFTPQCVWCKRNLTNIKTLAGETHNNYRFIGLSLTREGLSEYLAKNDIKFTVYTDISPSVISTYKLGSTPQTIVVSPNGKVIKNWIGVYNGDVATEVESFFKIRLPGVKNEMPTQ